MKKFDKEISLGPLILRSAGQKALAIGIVLAIAAVLVWRIVAQFNDTMYMERQQTLSKVIRSSSDNFKNNVTAEWTVYNLAFSIVSDCIHSSEDLQGCLDKVNTQHDFGSDYWFLVDGDGFYYCSDGVSGKLNDCANFLKTSPDRVEYIATLPHLNPRKTYMIYRGRFDRAIRLETGNGEKTIIFFAYAQDLTDIKNSIGGLFRNSSNVFIFDDNGILLYEDYGLQTLIEGHNIYRKMDQCKMPFGENPAQIEMKCRKGEDVVVNVKIKGEEYYFCTSPLGIGGWTLALLIPPQVVDAELSRGIIFLIIYSLTILLVISVLLVLLTFSSRTVDNERRMKESTQLMEAIEEASRAKSVFLSNMSHDIRTPINGIMGVTSIARGVTHNPQRLTECLDKIDGASKHLLSLVNDVLDMSRIESGKTKVSEQASNIVEICENCSDIINSQIADRELRFTTDFDVKHPNVLADEVHLRRIFINILGNSVKFTRDGGRILFRCRETACDENTVTCLFEIKDTGIGMSRKFLTQIFDAFSQEENRERSKYTGTGLGMAITKQLVDLLGGTIEVESEVNKGSSFYVTLSFKRDFDVREQAEETLQEASIEGVKILLVEDNDLNMEISESLLTLNGAVVEKAWDGLEALDRFSSKDIGYYDVILMDIMMPRMDGLEATKAIRALDREDAATIPIIAMTANAFDEDIKATREASMNAHLSKPIDMDNVKRTIASLVRKS